MMDGRPMLLVSYEWNEANDRIIDFTFLFAKVNRNFYVTGLSFFRKKSGKLNWLLESFENVVLSTYNI